MVGKEGEESNPSGSLLQLHKAQSDWTQGDFL